VPVKLKHPSPSHPDYTMFYCPGCKTPHSFSVRFWEWNKNLETPTVRPSLLTEGPSIGKCHLFITDGLIQFLGDSTHELANQTVDLPDWEARFE
jgi:hypothetical protein